MAKGVIDADDSESGKAVGVSTSTRDPAIRTPGETSDRLASAIGDGSIAVAFVYQVLQRNLWSGSTVPIVVS
jgi:hypothetical protein